jgi:3-hydroxyisobutyrate dehydrogenase/2-hydroxy-3-oxopropionate reductase
MVKDYGQFSLREVTDTMARIAFLGLGLMGGPMAGRLLDAGHDLTLWNRTPARAAALVERGARLAPTPAEAARGAEAVLTMLADPAALEAVVLGPGGLQEGLAPGTTFIEMSTVGPDAVRSLGGQLPAGVSMLDAPVLGSVPQVIDGSLKIFVGGARADFDRWSGLLGVLGRPVLVGPLGAGAAMKLVANSTLGALMTALGEALALADALGLDERTTLDVLADSPIGITARSKRDHILSGTYPPRFRLRLAGKDSRLVNEAGAGCGLRLAPAVRSWYEAAAAAQLGELDYSAVIAHIRGRTARKE